MTQLSEMEVLDGKLPPLAIIGMSFRFPQDAVDDDSIWDMLMARRCASSDFPKDRLNISSWHNSSASRLDSLSMKGGHFLTDDLAAFDAPFFSISAAEAVAMDPVQRFTLETAYRAIENAGIPMERLANTKTCVYTGGFTTDYNSMIYKDPANLPKYHTAGTSMNMTANRVSWFFDLKGPSANVDTACSSSLMALDLVCQSIWGGDSTMGLACGGSVMFAPENTAGLDNLGFLSKDSRCFSFDHRANGYARGEGFGVLVVKPLSDALRDNDTIRAVIRSSSSNQDGKTATLTQPGKDSQESLILDTYRKAGLDLRATRYFEAHGTGTPVGDPIEAGAIGSVFRKYRSQAEPLYIGSIKSNIGHLEGGSGIAGVVKVILALEKGIIPPISNNFEKLNPKIDADFFNIQIPIEAIPWPCDGLRRASVQSFGFGGANSHVILEDAYHHLTMRGLKGAHNTMLRSTCQLIPGHSSAQPSNAMGPKANDNRFDENIASSDLARQPDFDQGLELNGLHSNGATKEDDMTSETLVLPFSIADREGIARLKESWTAHLTNLQVPPQNQQQYMRNLAHTLSSRRTEFPWRSFAVATSFQNILQLPDLMSLPTKADDCPNLAFVFTGQGAQWHGMGKELMTRYPVFERSVLEAGAYLLALGCSWLPSDELGRGKPNPSINELVYSQTICTVLQVALVNLLESFGIQPRVVVGHSSGEIAAAYAAKLIDQVSAWKIAYYRGVVAAELAATSSMQGGMTAVGLSQNDTQQYIEQVSIELGNKRLVVACVNSPKSVTVSGDTTHLEKLELLLQSKGVFARRLKVTVAYHSFQMQEIADKYRSSLNNLTDRTSQRIKLPMMSSVTGTWAEPSVVKSPDYWVRNMVQPVLFSDALTRLATSGSKAVKKLDGSHRKNVSISAIMEVGPHSALQGPIKDILQSINREKHVSYISALKRNIHAVQTTLEAAGRLYTMGFPVDLMRVNCLSILHSASNSPKTLTSLPSYPFNHSQKYWHESRLSKDSRFRHAGMVDLLGIPSQDWNPLEAKWRYMIRTSELAWVEDHKITGVVLYPAVGMMTMAIEAAKQLADPNRDIHAFVFNNTKFQTAINVPVGTDGVEVNISLRPRKDADDKDSGWFDFRVCTYSLDGWLENSNGSIQVIYDAESSEIDDGREKSLWHANHRMRYHESRQRCANVVSPPAFYNHLKTCGYEYGNSFQSITSINYNGDYDVVSEVKTFAEPGLNEGGTASYTIHPTTFDGIVQTAFVAYTKGTSDTMPTMVPTYIERAWISGRGLRSPTAKALKVYANTHWTGLRETSSNIAALDSCENETLVEIEGAKTTVIASMHDSNEEQQKIKTRCHYIDSKPDLDMMSLEAIRSYCNALRAPEAEPLEFYTNVDFLITAYIQRALDTISSTPADFPHQTPHLTSYLDWMKHQMKKLENGTSLFSAPQWKDLLSNDSYVDELTAKVSSLNKQGNFFATVVSRLGDFLIGELDALEFLFQGSLVKDYYYHLYTSIPCVGQLRGLVGLLVHKNPAAKILEIGAGTGALTYQIMKVLSDPASDGQKVSHRYSSYDYTDISPFFFESAREEYQSQGNRMKFKVLNIENDPEGQGFETGTYDLVFAAAVLHATKDLEKTLKNCRKLLKSGGKLVLLELTRSDVFRTGAVFGLLEGWWLSSEVYRRWSPCVSSTKWNELLEATGFSGCDLVLDDYANPTCHEYGVIISTAVPPPSGLQVEKTELILVHDATQEPLARAAETKLSMLRDITVKLAAVDRVIDDQIKRDALYVFFLELEDPLWYNISPDDFNRFRQLLTSVGRAIWVSGGGRYDSSDPRFRVSDGLFRVLNAELSGNTIVALHLDIQSDAREANLDHVVNVSKALLTSESIDTEYIEHDGLLHINRLAESADLNKTLYERQLPQQRKKQPFGGDIPLRVTIGSPGLLNTLHFIEDKEKETELLPEEMEIQVHSTGINFRDLLVALGRLDMPTMGGDCAGVVTRLGKDCKGFEIGMRVATCCLESYRSYVRVNYRSVTRIPDSVSFSTAAAVTVNHSTAWYSLVDVARMEPGETILIHSGAGGTGQAAIQVAQYLGAKVFTTVSTNEKRDFLMRQYGIPIENIFSSRDTTFKQSIKRLTSGKGVDVVLNSLSGEGLAASWECVAPYGRFIEIGKKDIYSHSRLQMYQFARNVTFSAVDLASMNIERPERTVRAFKSVLDLVQNGRLLPSQPMQIYGVSELEKAFRSMQSGKNTGKIVIELRPNDYVETVIDTKSVLSLDPNGTYVIAGGFGGLGRSVTRWLVDRGAKSLIIVSRSGGQTPTSQAFIKELRSLGINIQAPACDISDAEALGSALTSCLAVMPPVKGCIQASMVLKDGMFESMTFDSWTTATLPKVQGSWNLHSLLPETLDFFIMFSSIAGIIGSRGQANYAAGNTFQDALARYRVSKGQRATALDLGAFLDVGILRENADLRDKFKGKSVMDLVKESELFALLEHYCSNTEQLDTPSHCQTVVGVGITPAQRDNPDAAYWLSQPSFRRIMLETCDNETQSKRKEGFNLQAVFANSQSLREAASAVTQALIEKLAKTLSMTRDVFELSKPMHTYGVDSLVAVELRSWFLKEVQAEIAVFDILGSATIADVAALASTKSKFGRKDWKD